MRPTGAKRYRGMGHVANQAQGVWGTGGMGHMGNRPQWVQGVWGSGGMGHMGNGSHGQWTHGQWGPWGTWAMGPLGPMGNWDIFAYNFIITGWILTKILLDIDIDVFYLNTGRFFHDGLN